jgi:hypothetical protein
MDEAMAALDELGVHADKAAVIIFDGLSQGTLPSRADYLRAEYTDETIEYREHNVPAALWQLSPRPPVGHRFWRSGDIMIQPPPLEEGSDIQIGNTTVVLPLGGVLPFFTIRGLKLPREAVLALTRSFRASQRSGRRKGVGGFAKHDEPLVREMHKLLAGGNVTSVHAAAVRVAGKAGGVSVEASKVRRLMKRYKAEFPDAP